MPQTAARPPKSDKATPHHVVLWDLFRAHAHPLPAFSLEDELPVGGQPFCDLRILVRIWPLAGAPGGFHTTHGSFPASPTELSLEINDKAARLTIMTQERNTEDLGFLASV